jgi:hypothetical protein
MISYLKSLLIALIFTPNLLFAHYNLIKASPETLRLFGNPAFVEGRIVQALGLEMPILLAGAASEAERLLLFNEALKKSDADFALEMVKSTENMITLQRNESALSSSSAGQIEKAVEAEGRYLESFLRQRQRVKKGESFSLERPFFYYPQRFAKKYVEDFLRLSTTTTIEKNWAAFCAALEEMLVIDPEFVGLVLARRFQEGVKSWGPEKTALLIAKKSWFGVQENGNLTLSPLMAFARSITIVPHYKDSFTWDAGKVFDLVNHPHFPHIRHLTIQKVPLDAPVFVSLAYSEKTEQLYSLVLKETKIQGVDLLALAMSPTLQLRELTLNRCDLTYEALMGLFRNNTLPLQSLDLGFNASPSLGQALSYFIQHPEQFPELKRLSIVEGNELTEKQKKALTTIMLGLEKKSAEQANLKKQKN